MEKDNRHHNKKFSSGLIYKVNDEGGVPDISSIMPLMMSWNHIPVVSGEAVRLYITLTGPLRLFCRVLPCNDINSHPRFVFSFCTWFIIMVLRLIICHSLKCMVKSYRFSSKVLLHNQKREFLQKKTTVERKQRKNVEESPGTSTPPAPGTNDPPLHLWCIHSSGTSALGIATPFRDIPAPRRTWPHYIPTHLPS